ncbi:polyprenyl synthetase family protein [Streptomyces flavotricini]|uniref:Polyprenyl synthetase family protein n=1 Tax=Streptomyces flavotricini TaxID=66888 RepID=A0ABS8EI74_9ACTN|nr:polyprenyl synthetase family protein [Streptomyces flavotricini]MCC0100643.1 polyprenyl synthetase family protein [Streptomyces flavotricini]
MQHLWTAPSDRAGPKSGTPRSGTSRTGADPSTRRAGTSPPTAQEAVTAGEAFLHAHLRTALSTARQIDQVFTDEVAGRVAGLVRRGGKRLRMGFVWCGWQAAGGHGDPADVLRLGAALELLQACALVHDDVMDGSPVRRGAPAVHIGFARMHREELTHGSSEVFGTGAAILAGDLALAWADDLFTEIALRSPHGVCLHREWRAMRTEMAAGQYRDIRAQALGSSDVTEAVTVATLKSALYSVVRPLCLGAVLAGADESVLGALRSAGRCAGLAFQLSDDILGTFGDPAETGKPADDDLRARKPTYLLATAARLASASGDVQAGVVLEPGAEPRSDAGIAQMRSAMERTGARAAVSAEITELAAASVDHFASTGATTPIVREFDALVRRAAGGPAGTAPQDTS